MEQENSTQLDSTTFIKKPLVIEPTILKEITSSPDVLLVEDAAPDSEPEEDRSPPKITVQTIDSQGTLKTLSNFSSGKFGRPNSATTQRSTTESGVMRNTKETVHLGLT